jgi:hypothetical protein
MGEGLRVWRLAFHCHSLLSHDSTGTFEEIAAAAEEIGLNAVILTDHYKAGNVASGPPERLGGVLFIPGVERRAMGGSLLAFGLREDFPPELEPRELARRVREQGGLSVAGHCEKIKDWGEFAVDGMEVYNLHAEFSQKSVASLAWRLAFLPVDAFFESSITCPRANLETWDTLLLTVDRHFPLLGCDAHANVQVFGPLGGTVGTYAEVFRLFSNHVLAPALERGAILDALRRGKVYGVFDCLGDANGFAMSYGRDGPSGAGAKAIIGDEAVFDAEAVLELRVPAPARLCILRDGRLYKEVSADVFREPLPGPGIWRAEVFLGDDLWILPSPIYVTRKGTPGR